MRPFCLSLKRYAALALASLLHLAVPAEAAPSKAAGAKADPASQGEPPEITHHRDSRAALAAILERAERDGGKKPRLIAFGEYHQLKGRTHIRSALTRFSDELWSTVQPFASDLVMETFIPEGNCGKEEKKVIKDVETTTKRPETTENELVKLVKQAKAQGVQPHILQVSCKDYQSVLDENSQVDYVKMLKLINDLLQKRIAEVRTRRQKAGIDKVVLAYGGALHNDLYPTAELAEYTFGQALTREFPGQYLEIDLYVPEYIASDKQILTQRWYPLYQKARKPTGVVVVRRGPGSFILVFEPTRSHKKK